MFFPSIRPLDVPHLPHIKRLLSVLQSIWTVRLQHQTSPQGCVFSPHLGTFIYVSARSRRQIRAIAAKLFIHHLLSYWYLNQVLLIIDNQMAKMLNAVFIYLPKVIIIIKDNNMNLHLSSSHLWDTCKHSRIDLFGWWETVGMCQQRSSNRNAAAATHSGAAVLPLLDTSGTQSCWASTSCRRAPRSLAAGAARFSPKLRVKASYLRFPPNAKGSWRDTRREPCCLKYEIYLVIFFSQHWTVNTLNLSPRLTKNTDT